MRIATILLAAGLGVAAPLSAFAATFAELVEWCGPEKSGGRPGLCSAYLETYLQALASPDPSLNDGVRACVPEGADRATIRSLVQAYGRQHPESAGESGVGGVGLALKGDYPCPK